MDFVQHVQNWCDPLSIFSLSFSPRLHSGYHSLSLFLMTSPSFSVSIALNLSSFPLSQSFLSLSLLPLSVSLFSALLFSFTPTFSLYILPFSHSVYVSLSFSLLCLSLLHSIFLSLNFDPKNYYFSFLPLTYSHHQSVSLFLLSPTFFPYPFLSLNISVCRILLSLARTVLVSLSLSNAPIFFLHGLTENHFTVEHGKYRNKVLIALLN